MEHRVNIKQFRELPEKLKKKAISFLMAADPAQFKDPGQTEDYIEGPIYSDGGKFLTLWEENTIYASLGIIMRDACSTRNIYFHNLYARNCDLRKISCLIDRAIEITAGFRECTFFAGLKKNGGLPEKSVLCKGFKKTHQMMTMAYAKTVEDCEKRLIEACVSFEPMTESTLKVFIDITNKAFNSSQNCGHIDDADIRQMLKTYPQTLLGFCCHNTVRVGTYELLPGKTGWINNIAVLPDHRDKGIGAQLVCGSIARLFKLGADTVKLNVVDTNHRALKLYKRLGFEIETVTSQWFTKTRTSANYGSAPRN